MIELKVEGMTCGHCASTVMRAVKQVDAGARVQVDLASGRVAVDGTAPEAAVVHAIGEAGYPASIAKPGDVVARRRGGCCCG